MFGSVEVHAWKGDADGGEGVIAPIATVAASGSTIGMMTSSPSGYTSLDVTGAAMRELQSIAGNLATSGG